MSVRLCIWLLLLASTASALGGTVISQETLNTTISITDRAYNYGETITVDVRVLNSTYPITGLRENASILAYGYPIPLTEVGSGLYRGTFWVNISSFTVVYNFTNETYVGYDTEEVEVTNLINISLTPSTTKRENLNATFTVAVTSIVGDALDANLTITDSREGLGLQAAADAAGTYTFQYNQTKAGRHALEINATYLQNSIFINHSFLVDGYYTTTMAFTSPCSSTYCILNRDESFAISVSIAEPDGTPVSGIGNNATVTGLTDRVIELSGTTTLTGSASADTNDPVGLQDVIFEYLDAENNTAYANITLNLTSQLLVEISGTSTAENTSNPAYWIYVKDIHGTPLTNASVSLTGASSGCTNLETWRGEVYCTVTFDHDATHTLTATATYHGNTGTGTHPVVVSSTSRGGTSQYGAFYLPPDFEFDTYPEEIIAEIGKEQIVTFVVENTGKHDSDWTTIKFSIIPPDWYAPRPLKVPKSEKRDILVRIFIPEGTEPGIYDAPAVLWASSCGTMKVTTNTTTFEPGQCKTVNVRFTVKETGQVVESEAWAKVSGAIENQTALLERIAELERMEVSSGLSERMAEGSKKLAEARDAYATSNYKTAKTLAEEAELIIARGIAEAEKLAVQEIEPLFLDLDERISQLDKRVGDDQVNVDEANKLLASARQKMGRNEYASAKRDADAALELLKDLEPIAVEDSVETKPTPMGGLLKRLLALMVLTPIIVVIYLKRDEILDLFSPMPSLVSKYLWPTNVPPNQKSEISVSLSVKNSHLGQLTNVSIVEALPLGFDYKEGSDSITSRKERPNIKRTMHGTELIWSFPSLAQTEAFVITYKFAFTPVGMKTRLPGTKYTFTDSTGKTQTSHTSYKIVEVGYDD